jgi:LacI family transcriptional regulator
MNSQRPPSPQEAAAKPVASLKEVAQLAQCSVSAAAAVLNGVENNTRVSQPTRQRIEHAGAQLGYRRNYLGSALRTGKSHVLGLLMNTGQPDERHGGFWSKFLAGIDQAAHARNCNVLLISADAANDELDLGERMLNGRQIDAMVIPSLFYQQRKDAISRITGAVAIAFTLLHGGKHPCIGLAHDSAIREAVSHLAALGHREILWLGLASHGIEVQAERRELFDAACVGCGVRSSKHLLDNVPQNKGPEVYIRDCAERIESILSRERPPTAIFAYNELVAFGVYHVAHARQLRIPDRLSIIAFDDIHGHLATPAMSVISLELHELGRQVGELALRLAYEPTMVQDVARLQLIPTRLILRTSCGPPSRS